MGKGTEAQNVVVENLFKSYFEEEKNLGDMSILLSAAEAAGLDKTETETFLKSDEGRAEVQHDINNWRRRYGINGVPYFVISTDGHGEIELSGAQEPSTFENVFEKFTQ